MPRTTGATKITLTELQHVASRLSVGILKHGHYWMTVTLPPLIRIFTVAVLLDSAAPPPSLIRLSGSAVETSQ